MAVGLPINAGSRILAATIAAIAPAAVIKAADQSVTSSVTLQNDNALAISLPVASATYLFNCYLDYEGGTQGSSDLKWTWAVPAGATLRYQADYLSTAGTAQIGVTHKDSDILGAGTNGAANLFGIRMTGTLVMAATTGTLQLKWAQNTSNATPTIVHAQSSLSLQRVS